MTTDNTLRRQTTGTETTGRTIVGTRSQANPDAGSLAEATVGTWEQIALQLSPIIGEGGFRALYTRAVHLTRSTYPWLAETQEPKHPSSPFSDLKESLERRELTEARAASDALQVTFTELLASFIGEELTSRLLRSARGNGGLKPEQGARK